MFKGIIVLFLMLAIILFPIPLKITLKYSSKVLEIYIYNKKLKLKTLLNIHSKKDVENDVEKNVKNSLNFISKFDLFKDLNLSDVKLIIYKLRTLKFKPILILTTNVEYGFDDAAFVAILFGLINSTFSFFYLLLKNFVKLNKISFKVIPHFKQNDLNMEILSIIYMSLAKIIYMASVMLFCLIKIKNNKTNLKKNKGGNLHG